MLKLFGLVKSLLQGKESFLLLEVNVILLETVTVDLDEMPFEFHY